MFADPSPHASTIVCAALDCGSLNDPETVVLLFSLIVAGLGVSVTFGRFTCTLVVPLAGDAPVFETVAVTVYAVPLAVA